MMNPSTSGTTYWWMMMGRFTLRRVWFGAGRTDDSDGMLGWESGTAIDLGGGRLIFARDEWPHSFRNTHALCFKLAHPEKISCPV